MSDTKNVKLGVCSVIFGGKDLGYTKGGVEVEVTTETKKVMVDQFGNSPINEYILARNVSIKVPLAETTLENLVSIMPGAVLTTNGTKAEGTVTFSTSAPVNNDSVTVNGVTFTFKTTPAGANDLAIPASVGAAGVALKNAINNSVNLALVAVSAVDDGAGEVTITADNEGTAGNAFTLAKVGTNIAVSGATLTGGTDATSRKVVVPNGAGISLLDYAQKMILHPQANAADNKEDDVVVPLAMTPGAASFGFKLDEERIFNCEFTAYPDPITRNLVIFGDEAAS